MAWNLFDSLEKRVPAKTSVAQPWVCKEKSDCVLLGTKRLWFLGGWGLSPKQARGTSQACTKGGVNGRVLDVEGPSSWDGRAEGFKAIFWDRILPHPY